MSREITEQLKALRHRPNGFAPDQAWIDKTRTSVLRNIETRLAPVARPRADEPSPGDLLWQRVREATQIFLPRHMVRVARHALTLLLIGSLAVGGWIVSASASEDSLPGDALYGVKLAIERTEVAVADVVATREVAAGRELDFAARRALEVKKAPLNEQKVVALNSLQKSMASTNKRLEATEKQSPEEAVAVAAVVNKKTEQILASLVTEPIVTPPASSADPLPQLVPAESIAVSQEVLETEKLIEDTAVKAVKVLIENGSTDSVKETVEKKLEKIATDLVDIHQGNVAASVATTTATTTSTLSVPKVTPPVGADASSSTVTTTSFLPAVTSTSSQVGAALSDVKQAQERVEAAGARIDEAKQLIQGNNLLGALEKVQELYTIKNEAKDAAIQLDIAKNVAMGLQTESGKPTNLPQVLPPASSVGTTTTMTSTPAMTTVSSSPATGGIRETVGTGTTTLKR